MRAQERGYALLLAITVVAVLALAVLASARVLGDVTTSATRLQESQVEAVAAESLLNRVAFLMLTEDIGARSLQIGDNARWDGSTLRLDGTLYAVESGQGAYVAIQDEAGLFNLNSTDEQALSALLDIAGLGDHSAQLSAALMDYADEDDLTRNLGAEAREYDRAGLPAPADRPFSSRWEAIEVLGWQAPRVTRSAVWTWLHAGPAETGLNVNTAPEAVLQAVLGDPRRSQSIIQQRESSPITDIAQLDALTSGTVRANGVTFAVAPAREFRVQAVFGSRRARHGFERQLELGGSDAAQPFRWVEERAIRSAPLRDGEAIYSLSLDAPAS